MEFTHRPFDLARDYAPLRRLLLHAWEKDPAPWLWPTVRLDSFRFGGFWREELENRRPWLAHFHVWERCRQGRTQLAGVAHPDGPHQVCLQVAADLRPATREAIETEMLAWFARATALPRTLDTGLETMVYQHDAPRRALLARLGWQQGAPCEVSRRVLLKKAPARVAPPDGFSLRRVHLDDPADLERLAAVTNRVFAHACFEARTWHALANAPTWNENWVAVAPTGAFASFCAIWYEPGLRAGWFEPVGTHPAFRRLGLARALMTAALIRLCALGAQRAYVDTGWGMDANALYAGLGFAEVGVAERWTKAAA